MAASLLLALLNQDLFERQDPDRFEMRLSPCLEFPKRTSVGASASLDFGGEFGCAGFDLRASFRSQFDRQVGEEFLQAIESDLASNALVLACQASPTICDAIKHYRLTASQFLQLQNDQCRGFEDALNGMPQKIRARAVLACIEEKKAQGWPLDRALEACQKAESLRDLSGRETQEVDILKELTRFLKLDGELEKLLQAIGQPVKFGGGSASADLNLQGIEKIFADVYAEFEKSWQEAMKKEAKLTADDLGRLAPPGAPRVRATDVISLALLPETRREAAIKSLASTSAYLKLASQLEELEMMIRAVEASPASEELAPVLRQQREWISSELARLEDRYRRQVFANESYSRVLDSLEEEVDRRFEARFADARTEAKVRQVTNDTRKWGDGCTDCGKKTYSSGTVRGKK